MLNLVGAIVAGALGFALILVVTRSLGPSGAGLFFEGIAFFSIASNVLLLGADVGLVRAIGAERGRGDPGSASGLLSVALLPILALSVLVAGGVLLATPQIADQLAPSRSSEFAAFVRVLVVALPVSVCYLGSIAATRGSGTMVPAVAIDKIGKPLLQLGLLSATVALGWGIVMLAAAWTAPIAVGLVGSLLWLRARRPRRTPRDRRSAATVRAVFLPFWRFSLPRGIAAAFQVTLLWLDTLLLGILGSARATGIYTVSTRYVMLGAFAGIAITQAVAPQLALKFAEGSTGDARRLFATATKWEIAATWPFYLTLALYAPTVLLAFGSDFTEGARVLAILSVGMLLSAATGPVDWVLLMGGRSGWNLLNTGAALFVNVGLNLILIPRLGMTGAAIAWSASIVVNSVAPLLETWFLLRLHPFDRGYATACVASVVCFGFGAVAVRSLLGQTITGLVVSTVIALLLYVPILHRVRDEMEFAAISEAIRSRPKVSGASAALRRSG